MVDRGKNLPKHKKKKAVKKKKKRKMTHAEAVAKRCIHRSTEDGTLSPDGTPPPAKRDPLKGQSGKGDMYRSVDPDKYREGFDAAFPRDCEECGREAGLYTDGTYNYYLHVYNRPQGKKKDRLRLCDECNSGEERWGKRVDID